MSQETPGRPPIGQLPPGSPPPPPPGPYGGYYPPPQSPGGGGSRVLRRILITALVLSLLANFYLAVFVAAPMLRERDVVYQEGDAQHLIAIIPVNGAITDDVDRFIGYALRQCAKRGVKAIVLRIDSPGGSAFASDRIAHRLRSFREQHNVPIVASFGGFAASGGYYIAAPADEIIAEPMCQTGSIGVIATAFTIEQLMSKVGITPVILKATDSDLKDRANNPFREWDAETDGQELQRILDELYDRFTQVVLDGRTNLTAESLKQHARGQLLGASAAKEAGLIDDIGFLESAVDRAKTLAGVPATVDPHVVVITEPAGILTQLLGRGVSQQPAVAGFEAPAVREWVTDLTSIRFEYRWHPVR